MPSHPPPPPPCSTAHRTTLIPMHHCLPQGRPQEVYGAFAAFRQKSCHPCQAPGEAAIAGSGGKRLGQLVKPVALSDSLVAAAEVLHILRPVAYALALRR